MMGSFFSPPTIRIDPNRFFNSSIVKYISGTAAYCNFRTLGVDRCGRQKSDCQRTENRRRLRERRTDALAYMPIPRINPAAQGFIPAKERKPEDGGCRAKGRDLKNESRKHEIQKTRNVHNFSGFHSFVISWWVVFIRRWMFDFHF